MDGFKTMGNFFNYKWFWPRHITLGITYFLDLIHCLEFNNSTVGSHLFIWARKQSSTCFPKLPPDSNRSGSQEVIYWTLNGGKSGPRSWVGIATDYGLDGPGIESRRGEIFRRPDRLWGPPSLLYNGYRVLPGSRKRPERDANPSTPSSAEV